MISVWILWSMKNHLAELKGIPMGVHTVVQTDDEEIPPELYFVCAALYHKRKSLLAPYYLVYMGENGNTVLGYLQGKRCLDYLKKLCQGEKKFYRN